MIGCHRGLLILSYPLKVPQQNQKFHQLGERSFPHWEGLHGPPFPSTWYHSSYASKARPLTCQIKQLLVTHKYISCYFVEYIILIDNSDGIRQKILDEWKHSPDILFAKRKVSTCTNLCQMFWNIYISKMLKSLKMIPDWLQLLYLTYEKMKLGYYECSSRTVYLLQWNWSVKFSSCYLLPDNEQQLHLNEWDKIRYSGTCYNFYNAELQHDYLFPKSHRLSGEELKGENQTFLPKEFCCFMATKY